MGVILLRIPRSRILRVMAGRKGLSIKCLVPLHPVLWLNWSSVGIRENAKGTVLAQIMDWPPHRFANVMQLVTTTNEDYLGDDQEEDIEEDLDLYSFVCKVTTVVSQYYASVDYYWYFR